MAVTALTCEVPFGLVDAVGRVPMRSALTFLIPIARGLVQAKKSVTGKGTAVHGSQLRSL